MGQSSELDNAVHRPYWLLRAVIAVIAVTFTEVQTVAADADTVECGPVASYVPPDSDASEPGSIALGFDGFGFEPDVFTIHPDAVIDPVFAANIGLVGNDGAPTCVSMTVNTDGDVTALAFAPSGSVCGSVISMTIPDAGFDIYMVGGRVGIPDFVFDASPEFGVPVLTAEASGNDLCLILTIEPLGSISRFTATTGLTGVVTTAGGLAVNGISVEESFLGANALAAFQSASPTAMVTIRAVGTVDQDTGSVEATASHAVTTSGCKVVEQPSGGTVSVSGRSFELVAGSSIDATLPVGQPTGVGIAVGFDGAVHLTSATIAGCPHIDDDDPSPAPSPSPTPVPPPPAPPLDVTGTFSPLPWHSGVTLTVWQGGTYAQLEAALGIGNSVWVFKNGIALGYTVGTPGFVKAAFIHHYPAGLPAGTPVLLYLR